VEKLELVPRPDSIQSAARVREASAEPEQDIAARTDGWEEEKQNKHEAAATGQSTTSLDLIASNSDGPIPGTSRSCSSEVKGPFSVR